MPEDTTQAAETLDLSGIERGDSEGWAQLILAMDSRERVKVPAWFFDYFLGVLPPRWMGRGAFVFAEGEPDTANLFENIYGEHFVRSVTWDEARAFIRNGKVGAA